MRSQRTRAALGVTWSWILFLHNESVLSLQMSVCCATKLSKFGIQKDAGIML